MRAALLACLLALPVAAQEPALPADAPTAVVLKAGQGAPFDGVLLSDAQAVADANVVQEAQSKVSLKVVVIAAVVALVAGAALGVAVDRVVRK